MQFAVPARSRRARHSSQSAPGRPGSASARSAAATTASTVMCVRHRKSPGTQTRCSHGRQGNAPTSTAALQTAGHARVPIAPARWARTDPRWASWSWRRRATARCLRRCRAVPGQPGHATRPTTYPRRFSLPPGSRAGAHAPDEPRRQQPPPPMVRTSGRYDDWARPRTVVGPGSTKESSGQRRKALPALTWMTTSSSSAADLRGTSRRRHWYRRRRMNHRDRVTGRARGRRGPARRGPGCPTGSRPSVAAGFRVVAVPRRYRPIAGP